MERKKIYSDIEIKLIKEAAIMEYKTRNSVSNSFMRSTRLDSVIYNLRRTMPFNLGIGILTCMIYAYFFGTGNLIMVFMNGIIYVTITSTIIYKMLSEKST